MYHEKYYEKYLKYKTKYLNLYNQKGGGEFINFNFDITANNSLPGYEYIRRIKGEADKPIRISVDYVDNGETQKINILSKLTNFNNEELSHYVTSMTNPIYFIIDDIEKAPVKYCVWLVSNEKEPTDVYLGYIRSEGFKCYTPTSRIPQGDLLMKTIINFARHVGFKSITLFDQSNRSCTYEEKDETTKEELKFNQMRSLRAISLLRTGHTYYGNYGFRPINPQYLEEYNTVSRSLTRTIREFEFDKNERLLTLREQLKDDMRIYSKFQKKYIEALYKPENQDRIFVDLNNEFIKSNCYYEVIIRDLYEELKILNLTDHRLYPGHFEKMKLIL